MAHGLSNTVLKLKRSATCKSESKTGAGSRRIFAPHFKLQVLDSYRNDSDCKGNQRATARKYGIHRRQIQKWLQVENNLRNTVCNNNSNKVTKTIDRCNTVIENHNAKMRYNSNNNHGIEIMALRLDRLQDASTLSTNDTTTKQQQQQQHRDDGVKLLLEPLRVGVPAPSSEVEVKADGSPAAAPVPLDFTIHSRGCSASPFVAAVPSPLSPHTPDSPIDLSFKSRIAAGLPSPGTPVPYNTIGNWTVPSPTSPSSLTSSPDNVAVDSDNGHHRRREQPNPDVWDLSTKKRKFEDVEFNCLSPAASLEDSSAIAQKTNVKLFKPYLDDFNKDSSSSSSSSSSTSSFDECPQPYCCAMPLTPPNVSPDYYSYNHNNNNIEIKAECTYTIQELQPKSNNLSYCCYPSYQSPPNYLLPSLDYEHNVNVCNNNNCCTNYEEPFNNNSSSLAPLLLKQRQSYSLDFKLSAIDCYYEDSVCKGNQRAVANKYNVHRRQVQKWLKQEDELRYRNEAVKYIELVR